jgi:hypothetical protein
MLRSVLLVHRWLGIFVGALMTVWCLSGFVMMYVSYPSVTQAEQLKGLDPLILPAPEAMARVALPADTTLAGARLEMLDGRPVLRLRPAREPGHPITQMRALPTVYDLGTGQPLAPLSAEQALVVGEHFARQFGIEGRAIEAAAIPVDQWTLETARRHQPLYRVTYNDAGRSTAYVAGNSGEIVQQTTGHERFWNWLGAVPHWLYPTILRQDGALWSQVVIWTSLIGCFLTVTGVWVGISRLRRKRDGRIGSPFRGIWWWHHIFGLLFGILTLTWVASGLFSMNPWGFLDSRAGFAEGGRLAGETNWGEVRAALDKLGTLPADTAQVRAAPLGGRMFLVAVGRDGTMTRYGADGQAALLDRTAVAAALEAGPPVRSLGLMHDEDAYYYAHHNSVKLPVWRAILDDGQQTRLYIDADSGALIRAVDQAGRGYRWLQKGLHDLDLPVLRQRPIWDLFVLPLLAAVTLVCATGTWMGVLKVGRDMRRARNRRRRARLGGAPALDSLAWRRTAPDAARGGGGG